MKDLNNEKVKRDVTQCYTNLHAIKEPRETMMLITMPIIAIRILLDYKAYSHYLFLE